MLKKVLDVTNLKYGIVILLLFVSVNGHGYLKTPAMRGSMWRFGKMFPKMRKFVNQQDDSLDAGGPGVVRANYPERMFGMCGDPHTDPVPRAHETGGKYGRFGQLGKESIAACYAPGSKVVFEMQVTIPHGGNSSFQLCVPGDGENESEKCFRKGFNLKRSDGTGLKTEMPFAKGVVKSEYSLPRNVVCDGTRRCILRWYWLASDRNDKFSIEYWNCADIQISNNCNGEVPSPVPTPSPSMSISAPAVPSASVSRSPRAVPASPSPVKPSQLNCKCNSGTGCTRKICDGCLYIGPRYGRQKKRDRVCLTDLTPTQCQRASNATTMIRGGNLFRCCSS